MSTRAALLLTVIGSLSACTNVLHRHEVPRTRTASDYTNPFGTVVLKEGSSGPEVAALQRALNSQLDPSPKLTVTGDFDPFTKAAVQRLQDRDGIQGAGTVGRRTKKALGADIDLYLSESSTIRSPSAPQVITRNVIEDSRGHYWLATWSGIVRYDGTQFINLTNQENLRRYRSFCALEDSAKNIWLGTTGAGVYVYDGQSYRNYTTADGLGDDTVLSLFEDRDGQIWLGGRGLTKYDGSRFTSFGEDAGFTNSDVHSISQDSSGALWLGTRGALFRYDGKTFENFTELRNVQIEANSYTPAIVDRQGHVWFGGSKGLFHYNGREIRHLCTFPCFSILEDSQGAVWYVGGTTNGPIPEPGTSVFNKFDPGQGIETILSSSEQIEVKAGAIFGLTEDRNGDVWFGTGQGVGRLSGDSVHYYDGRP